MKKFLYVFLLLTILPINSQALTYITDAGFYNCTVNASSLNIRSGPGTNYKIVKTVNKGTHLRALGRINGWYLVQTSDNDFGMVSGWYVTPKATENTSSNTNISTSSSQLNEDEQTILDLVNKVRREAGLVELKVDTQMVNVARLKSQDMEDNNYFSHTSPTYGTPFEMLKSFGVSYKTAGENIAGHSTAENAFNAWMNSSGHKANILNSNYNYTGIGIVSSNRYGKMFTQMFVGR